MKLVSPDKNGCTNVKQKYSYRMFSVVFITEPLDLLNQKHF